MRLSLGIGLLLPTLLVGCCLFPGAAWGQSTAAEAVAAPPVPARPSDTPYILWTPWISGLTLPRNFLDDRLFGFDYPAGALQLPLDARTLQLEVDAARGVITTGVAAADVPLGPARSEPLAEYASRLAAASLRRQWVSTSRTRINQGPTDSNLDTRSGLSIALPVELPKVCAASSATARRRSTCRGSERISSRARELDQPHERLLGVQPLAVPARSTCARTSTSTSTASSATRCASTWRRTPRCRSRSPTASASATRATRDEVLASSTSATRTSRCRAPSTSRTAAATRACSASRRGPDGRHRPGAHRLEAGGRARSAARSRARAQEASASIED